MGDIHSFANRDRRPQARVGDLVDRDTLNRLVDLMNSEGGLAQTTTIAVNAATNSGDYTLTFALLDDDGETIFTEDVEFTADASATVAEVGAGIVAAINANPFARMYALASFSTPTITIQGLTENQSFTVTRTGAAALTDLGAPTNSVTAAADETIPFGRAIITQGYGSDPNEANERGALPLSTRFTAQVATVTPVYGAGSDTSVRIRDMHTGRIIADTIMRHDTGLADLIAELVLELNTQLPANSVLAANVAGTSMTLTAEKPGFEFDVEVGTGEGVAATPSTVALAYTTGPSRATSILRSFRGITLRAEDEAAASIGGQTTGYGTNEVVKALRESDGGVWIQSSETPTAGGDVWVETTAGTTLGRLYTTASATRLLLARNGVGIANFERGARSGSGDNIAAVSLRG